MKTSLLPEDIWNKRSSCVYKAKKHISNSANYSFLEHRLYGSFFAYFRFLGKADK